MLSKSYIVSVLLSVVSAASLFFLLLFLAGSYGVPYTTPSSELPSSGLPNLGSQMFGTACEILIVDEAQDDRVVQEKLISAGLKFVSESNQFVPIDDYGTLKFIPLDSFRSEIELFDPRDSGYADRLRSFFVHEGNRFFYRLSRTNSQSTSGKLKSELSIALQNIPFSFVVLGQRESGLIYYLFLLISYSFALFFSPSRRLLIFQFPVFLAIGGGGFFSLILAAMLAGLWELLRQPLGELTASKRYKKGSFNYAGKGFGAFKEYLKPYRFNLLLVLAILFFLAVLSFFQFISPILLFAVCASFSILYYLSLLTEKARTRRHIPFTPVLLLPHKLKTFSFFPLLLPFGLASLLAIILPQASSIGPFRAPAQYTLDPGYLITQEDYNRHMNFQSSFFYRPINRGFEALNQNDYFRYYLGEDGLIAGRESYLSPAESENTPKPPFPLDELMEFLLEYNKYSTGMPIDQKALFNAPGTAAYKEWLTVAIILTICLLDLVRSQIKPKKGVPVLRDKRMAA